MNTPNSWFRPKVIPKAKKPMNKVKRGTNEFKIDAMALSISVWANANKNIGIKLPTKPDKATQGHSFLLIVRRDLNPIINRNSPANTTRIAPN